jgi:Ca2+-binding RTX toxin-like protein
MSGGSGNDLYYLDNTGDQVVETADGGTDKVVTSISYTLSSYIENLSASGSSALNLTGNSLNNVIVGNAGANTISGGEGNDRFNGRAGNDQLTGGTGKDVFVFNAALNKTSNVDTITDFSVADDTVWLENAIFNKLTQTGELSRDYFTTGTAAKDANDYIIYNKSNGYLYYDADGSGQGAAVLFAKLPNKPALTNLDFIVT